MTMTILPTQNKEWGFWGTLASWNRDNERGADRMINVQGSWNDASLALVGLGGLSREDARDLLDSRIGRHFADTWVSRNCVPPTSDILNTVRHWRSSGHGQVFKA